MKKRKTNILWAEVKEKCMETCIVCCGKPPFGNIFVFLLS